MLATQSSSTGVQSNSAIPMRNEKGKKNKMPLNCFIFLINFLILGEIYMKKVKVQRYISGKRPEYAQRDSSDESSAEDDFIEQKQKGIVFKDIQLEQKQ
jgi:hypothetical protein